MDIERVEVGAEGRVEGRVECEVESEVERKVEGTGSSCHRRKRARTERWLAALAVLVISTTAGAEEPPSPSPAPEPAAAPGPSVKPLARRDLVVLKDGKLTIDHFLRCTSMAPNAKGANGSNGARLQFLVHAQGSADEISRDRFVASTTRAALREIDALAVARDFGSPDAPPTCHEVGAPNGDVDYELKLVVKPGVVDVSVVDVTAKVLARKVSQQHGANACVTDSMGTLYCAKSSEGTAVKSTLGQVVCARGECVRSTRGEWQCSRASGGWAELSQSGAPECEYGCYSPSTSQCQRMR
jgi:hypothetical protein